MLNKNNFYLDINNLIFNYKNISIADFCVFIENNQINSKSTIIITFFLILKSNRNFWSLLHNTLDFNITPEDYFLQLQLLKTFNSLLNEFSSSLDKSLLDSGLDFNNTMIEQVFFDLSLLSNLDKVLFYSKKTNIKNIMLVVSPINKFNLIKNRITKQQQKQLFLACVNHFRTSSTFILNDLFKMHILLFKKNIILKYLNIFSQCDSHIQTHVLTVLLSTPTKQAFKTGTQLSYSHFSNELLIDFFNNLYNENCELFFLFSSGFISNPQQHKPFIISYLLKKNNFIHLNDRLQVKNKATPKIIKI